MNQVKAYSLILSLIRLGAIFVGTLIGPFVYFSVALIGVLASYGKWAWEDTFTKD